MCVCVGDTLPQRATLSPVGCVDSQARVPISPQKYGGNRKVDTK